MPRRVRTAVTVRQSSKWFGGTASSSLRSADGVCDADSFDHPSPRQAAQCCFVRCIHFERYACVFIYIRRSFGQAACVGPAKLRQRGGARAEEIRSRNSAKDVETQAGGPA